MLRAFRVALVASVLGGAMAHAYVDIELEGGRHVIGQYYTAQGAKLVVYRPSGAIEIDRATVREIREPSGNMPSEVQSPTTSSAAATAGAPSTSAPAKTSAPIASHSKDPAQREQELADQLILLRFDHLSAWNRGDNDAMKKVDKQINTLETERRENWKKLHPDNASDSSAD